MEIIKLAQIVFFFSYLPFCLLQLIRSVSISVPASKTVYIYNKIAG